MSKYPSSLRPSFRRPLVQCADVSNSTAGTVEFIMGPKKVRLVVVVDGVRTEEEKNGKDHVLGLLRSMVMFALKQGKVPMALYDVGSITRSIYDKLPKSF